MRKPALQDLPAWPRYLDRTQAAAYLGVSVPIFDAEVRAGLWPKPRRRTLRIRGEEFPEYGKAGGKMTWDRVALDAAADLMNGAPGAVSDEAARMQAAEIINATPKTHWVKRHPQKAIGRNGR